jgi:type II secretory pathway pseudopilin PulG
MKPGRSQKGFTLLELLFAGFILTVGMLGGLVLIFIAIQTNNRNKMDTTGTMLTEMFIEKINTLSSQKSNIINFNDCNGVAITINTADAVGTGTGAPLVTNAASPDYGRIDFTVATGGVPAGYRATYNTCGGAQYDVRWNVRKPAAPDGSVGMVKYVVVAARQIGGAPSANNTNVRYFSPPVSLRTIVGP